MQLLRNKLHFTYIVNDSEVNIVSTRSLNEHILTVESKLILLAYLSVLSSLSVTVVETPTAVCANHELLASLQSQVLSYNPAILSSHCSITPAIVSASNAPRVLTKNDSIILSLTIHRV